MTSRTRLYNKRAVQGLLVLLLMCGGPVSVFAASDPCLLRGSAQNKAMLTAYMERLSAPKKIPAKTLNDWKARREYVRKLDLQLLGLDPMPERVPLDVHYGGSLDREGYIVKRVYWQTWPGIYGSGYLYLPKTPGKHPAILNPVGHWANYTKNEVPQTRCIALAKRGYVALAIDLIHVPTDSYLIGASSPGIRLWTNIRAVDFLQSLPEVDADKIGCTGASGGGQQTLHMMVADDRIKAAVPAVGVWYWRRLMEPVYIYQCLCAFDPCALGYFDQADMCAVYAPKPALFLTVSGDWEANFHNEEYKDFRRIWELYGAADRVDCLEFDCGHEYNRSMREAMYAWFDKWLKGIDYPNRAVEPDVKTETVETLNALDAPVESSLVTAAKEVEAWTYQGHTKFYKEKFQFKNPEIKDLSGLKQYQEGLRKKLLDLLAYVPAKGRVVRTLQPAEIAGMQAERFIVQSEGEIQVPALLFRPKGTGPAQLVIMLHPGGKQAIVKDYADQISSLVSRGVAVLLPDLRLMGELNLTNWEQNFWGRSQKGSWDFVTLIWGRPDAGMALTDLRACLEALAGRNDLSTNKVKLVGLGNAGSTALFLAALEPRIEATVIENIGKTYAEPGSAVTRRGYRDDGMMPPLIFNILRVGDLPQVAAAVAPRRLVIGAAGSRFGFSQDAYAVYGAGSKLDVLKDALQPSSIADAVVSAAEQRN
ncbi:MAG: prolyl oligopeptidase family serine peptidase [Armatimonadetes bacterium]|nr:prolyl oligopeptidase family serine peptidase [Armatimonadota bacterium]